MAQQISCSPKPPCLFALMIIEKQLQIYIENKLCNGATSLGDDDDKQ